MERSNTLVVLLYDPEPFLVSSTLGKLGVLHHALQTATSLGSAVTAVSATDLISHQGLSHTGSQKSTTPSATNCATQPIDLREHVEVPRSKDGPSTISTRGKTPRSSSRLSQGLHLLLPLEFPTRLFRLSCLSPTPAPFPTLGLAMCGTNALLVLSTAPTATTVPMADVRLPLSLLFNHVVDVLTTGQVAAAVTGRLQLVLPVAVIMVVSLFLSLTVTVEVAETGATVVTEDLAVTEGAVETEGTAETEEAAVMEAMAVTAVTEDLVETEDLAVTEGTVVTVAMVETEVMAAMDLEARTVETVTKGAILPSSSTRLLKLGAEASCRYSSRFPLPSLFYRLGTGGTYSRIRG